MGNTKTLVDSSRNFNPYGQTTAEAVLSALRPYKLKDLGGGRYRCNSPFRPDSNSHAFSVAISDGEHGTWFDHVGGESGSLYDLAESLGVRDGYGYDAPAPAPTKPKPERPPKPEPPAPTGNDPQSLADAYAAGKGVPLSVFISANWTPVTREGRPALSISTQTGARFRFLDDAKPKFKSPPGYKQCAYGLARALKFHAETGRTVVLCNGEPSTVVGQHFGIPAFTIAGKGESSAIAADILDKLKANREAIGGKLFVTYDADDAGHMGAHKTAGQLREIGFEVTCLDFGADKFAGYDLADFCREHPEDAAERLYTLPELPAPDTGATVGFIASKVNPRKLAAHSAQFLSVLCAELEMTATNKVTLLALLGASGDRAEFSLSNAVFGKHLRKCDGDIFPSNPGEIDPDAAERKGKMSQAAGRAWKRLDEWQRTSGVVLVERTPGFMDMATGESASSRYRVPFVGMMFEAIETARASEGFYRSPGRAIENAARELASRLLESAKPTEPRNDRERKSRNTDGTPPDERKQYLRLVEQFKAQTNDLLRRGVLETGDVSAILGNLAEIILDDLPTEPAEDGACVESETDIPGSGGGYQNGTLSLRERDSLVTEEGMPTEDETNIGGGYKSDPPPTLEISENEPVADSDFVEFANSPEKREQNPPGVFSSFPAPVASSGATVEPEWVADRFAYRTHDGTPADVLPFKPKDDLLTIDARRWDADGLLDLLPVRLECDDGGEWMKPAENARRWLAMLETDDRRKRDEASAGLAGLLPDVCAYLRGAGAMV